MAVVHARGFHMGTATSVKEMHGKTGQQTRLLLSRFRNNYNLSAYRRIQKF